MNIIALGVSSNRFYAVETPNKKPRLCYMCAQCLCQFTKISPEHFLAQNIVSGNTSCSIAVSWHFSSFFISILLTACPKGFIYESCTRQCPRTCANINIDEPLCEHPCKPACVCPEGHVIDYDVDGREICVKVEACGCFSDGIYYPVSTEPDYYLSYPKVAL